jgi:hypothetical protein
MDAAPAGMGVDRGPDRLAALRVFRQAVPVIADPLHHRDRRMMQANFILAGAAVPDPDCTVAAVLQVMPHRYLIVVGRPLVVGKANVDRHCGIHRMYSR